jgi:hypothetical protein
MCYLLGAAAVVATGCSSSPGPGRVDVSATTDAELRDQRIQPVALIEFSDQVGQKLPQQMARIDAIADLPGRATVIMGDLNNQTGNVSSEEFELLRARVRNNLLHSPVVRDKIKFVEPRGRMIRATERELGTDAAETAVEPYDPASTFVLNGDFYRVGRGDTNLYYMEFHLVHTGSNEIVFAPRYDIKQVSK